MVKEGSSPLLLSIYHPPAPSKSVSSLVVLLSKTAGMLDEA